MQLGKSALLTSSIAAGLNLTEPCSTGIGGDMFCLFYDAKTKKVSALNGSGRAGAKCTLETIRKDLGLKDGESGKIPMNSVHSVTVPGAAAGWVDTVEMFGSGKLSLEQILAPAIEMGESGFPIHELASTFVSRATIFQRNYSTNIYSVEKWREVPSGSVTKL
jgi:gamma-glutamyltranspeptidase/glutathione hydrolase